MFKKLGIAAFVLVAALVLINPPQAQARVHWGVYIGPSYPAPEYPGYAYPYAAPYRDYYAPPVYQYGYAPPAYAYPYGYGYSYGGRWGGWDRGHEWREHERHEYREHGGYYGRRR